MARARQAAGSRVPGGPAEQLQIGHHRLQLVVEVVRDRPGHAAQAFGLLQLPVPVGQFLPVALRLAAAGDVPGDADQVRLAVDGQHPGRDQADEARAVLAPEAELPVLAGPLRLEVGHERAVVLRTLPDAQSSPGPAGQFGPGEAGQGGEAGVGVHQPVVLQADDEGRIGAGVEDPLQVLLVLQVRRAQALVQHEDEAEGPEVAGQGRHHEGEGLEPGILGIGMDRSGAQGDQDVQGRVAAVHEKDGGGELGRGGKPPALAGEEAAGDQEGEQADGGGHRHGAAGDRRCYE